MDLDGTPNPLFTVGQELATFLASSGILSKAWEEIRIASTNSTGNFVIKEYEGVVYVSFPAFYVEDFAVRGGKYGECNAQNESRVFSECLKGTDEGPVLVHKGALTRFQHILDKSDFKEKMERFTKKRGQQTVIFVGHSIGGAVATLATIWLLEQRSRQISPFCITFGSPLVGNVRLMEAIGRDDWSGKFCHVVSKHDIVPRMLLAQFESIAEPLDAVLPHWGIMMGKDFMNVTQPYIQEACKTLLKSVLQCTSTIANNYAGESGLRSPYTPFGTYMFCSNYGATCIEDSQAVLKMLHFTMQIKEGEAFDEIAGACILEHTGYGDMLKHITEDLFNTRRIQNPLSDSSFEIGIELQLEAMGVGVQNDHARLALIKAGEVKKKYDMNIAELNDQLSKNQSFLALLEWYKRHYEGQGICYYDFSKDQSGKKDIKADYWRINLENFWNDIIDKVEKHELPSNFQSQNKWINAGNAYRKLVEPLDIAYYYRTRKDNKSYLSEGVRPRRHIDLEKWLNEKNKTRRGRDNKKPRTKYASVTEDSRFWAYLEDACQDLKSHQHAQSKENLERFEDYVWKMIKDRSISAEIFLEQSSFMTWWQEYRDVQLQSPQWKLNSGLFEFMEREGWKLINEKN